MSRKEKTLSKRSGYDVWCDSCGCLMRLRRGKYGEFYGCTGYPKCTNTRNMRDVALEMDPPNDAWDEHYGSGGDYDPGGSYD